MLNAASGKNPLAGPSSNLFFVLRSAIAQDYEQQTWIGVTIPVNGDVRIACLSPVAEGKEMRRKFSEPGLVNLLDWWIGGLVDLVDFWFCLVIGSHD